MPEPNESDLIAESTDVPPAAQGQRVTLKQVAFATLGIALVALAAVGVFLPGIPTVGPLLLASFFFTKSSPWLEQRLIRNRFFAKYLPYLDGTREMSPKAKLATIATMWTSIAISCLILRFGVNSSPWMVAVVVSAGIVGTVFIWRFGRAAKPSNSSCQSKVKNNGKNED